MNELLRTTSILGVIISFLWRGRGQQGRLYPGNKIMMKYNDYI
jgi:hypothetical protein